MGSTLSSVKRDGEGIVQTTNSLNGAAKAEVVRKSADLNRSWGFKSPRPHHHFPQWSQDGTILKCLGAGTGPL